LQTAVLRLLYLLTYFIVQFLGVWSGSIRSRDFSAADRRVVGRQGPSTMRGGGGGGGAELKASSLISPRSQQPALGRGLREERERDRARRQGTSTVRIRRRKSNHRHHHRRNHGRKVGGDVKWDGCRTSSFISSVPSPSPTVTPSLFHPFPSLLRFSPPLNVARRFGAGFVRLRTLPSVKNGSHLQKLEGTKCRLGPRGLRSWRGRVPRVP